MLELFEMSIVECVFCFKMLFTKLFYVELDSCSYEYETLGKQVILLIECNDLENFTDTIN